MESQLASIEARLEAIEDRTPGPAVGAGLISSGVYTGKVVLVVAVVVVVVPLPSQAVKVSQAVLEVVEYVVWLSGMKLLT